MLKKHAFIILPPSLIKKSLSLSHTFKSEPWPSIPYSVTPCIYKVRDIYYSHSKPIVPLAVGTLSANTRQSAVFNGYIRASVSSDRWSIKGTHWIPHSVTVTCLSCGWTSQEIRNRREKWKDENLSFISPVYTSYGNTECAHTSQEGCGGDEDFPYISTSYL